MTRTQTCPICKKPTIAAHAPFCSKRCRDVDLSRWLGGAYAIETNETADGLQDHNDNDASKL